MTFKYYSDNSRLTVPFGNQNNIHNLESDRASLELAFTVARGDVCQLQATAEDPGEVACGREQTGTVSEKYYSRNCHF